MSARILLVGSGATGSLEGYYAQALASIPSLEVDFFDVDLNWRKLSRRSLIRRAVTRLLSELRARVASVTLIRYLARKRDEFVAAIIIKGAEFSPQVLERARALQRRAVWININPDDPFAPGAGRIVASLAAFDVYCTWSKRLVPMLARGGCRRVFYLPFGYDRVGHAKPATDVPARERFVSFCGAWDREREEVLTELSCFDLKIYGNGWERVSRRSPLVKKVTPRNLYGVELAKIVNRSVAALNLLRPQNRGSHNMRTFEIPAMGGLMMTTRSEEQEVWFPDGTASLMFTGVDELKARLMLVTNDPDFYSEVRKQGEERLDGHSYDDRARALAHYLGLSGGCAS